MSEYSISSPEQVLATVEYLPSGVVYAATEDLPAAARQVIEGLQDPGSLGPGVEWRGPRRSLTASVAGPSAQWRSTT